MVRETRFSFDNPHSADIPHIRDTFDDADDALLDGFSPTEDISTRGASKKSQKNPNSKKESNPEKQPEQDQQKRHLADADWLNDHGSVISKVKPESDKSHHPEEES